MGGEGGVEMWVCRWYILTVRGRVRVRVCSSVWLEVSVDVRSGGREGVRISF